MLLKDIRNAWVTYMNTQVQTTCTTIPAGSVINVGENFMVNFVVRNMVTPTSDAMQLKNVVYWIQITDATKAKLLKPPVAMGVARSGTSPSSPAIPDTAFPVSEYYLHPVAGMDQKVLQPGEEDTLNNLPAKAITKGNTTIHLRVYADPDLAWLFPAMEDTPAVSRPLAILE